MLRLHRLLVLCALSQPASSLRPDVERPIDLRRREFALGLPLAVAACPAAAGAAAAPRLTTAETTDRASFDSVGGQTPARSEKDVAFTELDGGVKIKTLREGSGERGAERGARTALILTGRLLNLNGVKFYTNPTAEDKLAGAEPLRVTLGEGKLVPGLERGIVGMRKGEIRRIIVPPALGYGGGGGARRLQPTPGTPIELQALESVTENPRRDASLLFDVKLERFLGKGDDG